MISIGLAVVSAVVCWFSFAAMDGLSHRGLTPVVGALVAGVLVGPAAVVGIVVLFGLAVRCRASSVLRVLLTAAEVLLVLGVLGNWGVLLLLGALVLPFEYEDVGAESMRATLAEQVPAVEGVADVRGVEVVRPDIIGVVGHNVVVEVDLEPGADREERARAVGALAGLLDGAQSRSNRGLALVHAGPLVFGVTSSAVASAERAGLAADLHEATDAVEVSVAGPSEDEDLIREGEENSGSTSARVELVTDEAPAEIASLALPVLSGSALVQPTYVGVSTTVAPPFPDTDALLLAGHRSLSVGTAAPEPALAAARALDQQPWVLGYAIDSAGTGVRVAVADRARADDVLSVVRDATRGAGASAEGTDEPVTVVAAGPEGRPVEVLAE